MRATDKDSGPKIKLQKLMEATNICDLLDKDQIKEIGNAATEGYRADLNSRSEWERRQAEANKLALQVFEEKTFPWAGASSIKFPLVTVAALQYHARAYPSLVPGNDLVYVKIWGEDPDGQKAARAKRIADHMSWQNLEQDDNWEPGFDRLLLAQAISGTIFQKRVFEPGPAQQVTQVVQANDLVINYYTKSLDDSPRYTHRFYLTNNNIKQRELDGRFVKVDTEAARRETDEITDARDESQGTEEPDVEKITPFWMGEQYCWLDLDGDGYQEPYIITFDIDSGEVRRIVARYLPSQIKNVKGETWKQGEDVYKITPVRVFTKYGFIPSPDGGFYDLGLGTLMGPLNASVNSAINQIFDLGTMSALGGGFVGRGFKSKGGPITFAPNTWYPVDAPGDDLRKNILPMPKGEAPDILFKLISFIVSYAERIVSATDLQVGENIGQNTPAQTAQTMDRNGRHVYNAIYKRTWRSQRGDFRIQLDLNTLFIDREISFTELSSGKDSLIRPDDYAQTNLTLRPAADPYAMSDDEKIKQATQVLEASYKMLGFNKYEATQRWLKALRVPDIQKILPQPQTQGQDGKPQPAADFPPPPNPKVMDAQLKLQEFELEKQKWELEKQTTVIELQGEVQHNQAEIMKMYAQAEKAMAEAKGIPMGHQIAIIEAQIGALKTKNEGLLKALAIMQKAMEKTNGQAGTASPAGRTGAVGAGGGNAGASQVPPGNGQVQPGGMVG